MKIKGRKLIHTQLQTLTDKKKEKGKNTLK